MAHWLDRQAKRLARGQVTRRSFLFRGAGAASGAVLSRYIGDPAVSMAAVPAHPRTTRIGPCTLKSDRKTSTLSRSVRVRFGARHLTLDVTQTEHHGHQPSAALRNTITLGNTMVLEVLVEKTSRGSAAEGTILFGRGFSGVREITFTTSDGKTLSGKIDGRSYSGYRLGTDPSKIRFRDGMPPPSARVEPALGQAMHTLFETAHKESRRCHAAAKHHRHHAEDLVAVRSAGGSAPATAVDWVVHQDADQFGQPGRSDNPRGDTPCVLCQSGCDGGGGLCAAGIASGCSASGPFYGICLAVGIGGCLIAQAICLGLCFVGGAPCCPVTCGPECCSNGDTCLDTDTGFCCPQGTTACNGGQCCDKGDVCLNNGHCCPPDKVSTESICCPNSADKPPVSCKGKCCDTGDVCNDGVCCPPTSPICNGVCCIGGACLPNGNCCMSPSHLCGDVCCGPFNTCCADVCCSGAGDVCISGTCCPSSKACGNTCCSSSQVCTDPSTGTCGPTPCPQGQTICQNFTKTASTCCNNGLQCCNGTSCCDNTMGLYCCGTLGCVTSSACVH
jgi:hypothetical protein